MSVIDSLEFARTGQTLRGNLPVSGLTRLHDGLFDSQGEVEYALRGGCDERGRPTLTLEIRTVLHLRCQRCLGLLDYPMQLANTVLLVGAAEAESGALDDEALEWIVASAALDVDELVEDEIILSLPYAPRHEEGSCRHEAMREETAPGPFAALAALRKDIH